MNALRFSVGTLVTRSTNYISVRHFKRYLAPVQKQITLRKKNLGPQPVPKRNTFLEWNRDAELYAFNERLNEKFELQKLNNAFIFKSYLQKEKQNQEEIGVSISILEEDHNESLYIKGRELTSNVVKKYLQKSFPHIPQAALNAFHDYLMSNKVLAEASANIGTKDIILCAEHPVNEETLALSFLALVGALIESTNDQHAAIFVRDFLITALAEKDLMEIWCPDEPLSFLDEILQEQRRPQAEPRIISQAGKNTLLSSYQIAVYSNKEFLGSGFGQTINEAKDIAAINALCRMFGLLDSSQPLRFNEKVDIS